MVRTVLIVEDTETCRETLELALLKLSGVAVRWVATAEEALQCLAADEICALITDLNLPRMDGFELIESVRSQPGRSSLPIVVISGDSDPRTAARLAGLGANAYFSKPFSPTEVRKKVEQLIDGR
ncbi:MAG TPA: response regulator [Bryobacteraceae bacterium]|nr:response regulator [Bryobacteraceae bacterium]